MELQEQFHARLSAGPALRKSAPAFLLFGASGELGFAESCSWTVLAPRVAVTRRARCSISDMDSLRDVDLGAQLTGRFFGGSLHLCVVPFQRS